MTIVDGEEHFIPSHVKGGFEEPPFFMDEKPILILFHINELVARSK